MQSLITGVNSDVVNIIKIVQRIIMTLILHRNEMLIGQIKVLNHLYHL